MKLLWKYLIGFLKNLLHPGICLGALVDPDSRIDRLAKIYWGCKIFRSNVGKHTYICPFSSLSCAEVGNFCSIASGVQLGLPSHRLDLLSTSPIFFDRAAPCQQQWSNAEDKNALQQVTVGSDVWIGANAIIRGGIRIGHGAVIGAGAVVTRDIPPYAVAAGVPARIIRCRFPADLIEELEKLQWWNFPDEKLKKLLPLFQRKELSVQELRAFLAQSTETVPARS